MVLDGRHVEQGVRRMGKHTSKEFEDVTEVLNCTKDEDMVVFFKRSCTSYALLAAAPLSRTH